MFPVVCKKEAVLCLKSGKARGIDDIPNECFKFAPPELHCTWACIGVLLAACVLPAHWKNGGGNAVFPVRLGHEC